MLNNQTPFRFASPLGASTPEVRGGGVTGPRVQAAWALGVVAATRPLAPRLLQHTEVLANCLFNVLDKETGICWATQK